MMIESSLAVRANALSSITLKEQQRFPCRVRTNSLVYLSYDLTTM